MPPKIRMGSNNIGAVGFKLENFSPQGAASAALPNFSLFVYERTMTYKAKMANTIKLGMSAAINSLPTDISTTVPYTMSDEDGGIKLPTDAPPTVPHESRLSKPRSIK